MKRLLWPGYLLATFTFLFSLLVAGSHSDSKYLESAVPLVQSVFVPVVDQNVRMPFAGATVSSPDGNSTLQVPTGFHSTTGPFTVVPGPAIPGAVGTVYHISPDGTIFSTPAQLTLKYAQNSIPSGVLESDLTAGFRLGNSWIPFSFGVSQNTNANIMTGTLQHLSDVGIFKGPRVLTGTQPVEVVSGHGFVQASRRVAKVGDKVIFIASTNPGATTWRCGCEFCPLPQGINSITIGLPGGLSVTSAPGATSVTSSTVRYDATQIPFEQAGCGGDDGYFAAKVIAVETLVTTPTNAWTTVSMSTRTASNSANAQSAFGSLPKDAFSRKLLASQEGDRPGTRESDALIYDVDQAKPVMIRGEDWNKFGGDIRILWNDLEIKQISPTDNFSISFTPAGEFPIDSCRHTIRAVQEGADGVIRSVDVRLAGIAKALAAQNVKDKRGGNVNSGDPICANLQAGPGTASQAVTIEANGALIAAEELDSTTGLPIDVPTFISSPANNILVKGKVLAPVVTVSVGNSTIGYNNGTTPNVAGFDPRLTPDKYKIYTIEQSDRDDTGVIALPRVIDTALPFFAVSDEATNEFKGTIRLGGISGASTASIYTSGTFIVRNGLFGSGGIFANTNIVIERSTTLTAVDPLVPATNFPIALATSGTVMLR